MDEALTREGQSRIARHLLEQVPRDCDVVFDVSHGFRHQPIIATHVVSMMRWTHGIRSVRFFSGVLEASRNGVAPVVELPICQQLAETTEAAATLELTGNYEPLAKQLQVDAGTACFSRAPTKSTPRERPRRGFARTCMPGWKRTATR